MKPIILFLISLFIFPVFIYGDIPAEERAALIALYKSTNGDNWTDNTGWKTAPLAADGFALPGTEGNWFGITITDDHVTYIVLNHNHLNGTIPPGLGNLGKLEYLDLQNNSPSLSGKIPPELGNLGHLKRLWLNGNRLYGSIPPELGNLSSLEWLFLRYNQLSGSIPLELRKLGNLKKLLLEFNDLSGSIPLELGNLSNLEVLSLENNYLTGGIPPELGNLSSLEGLLLGSNDLSGSIPSELEKLSNLKRLLLYNNYLSGSIPPELGNISNLEVLSMYGNQLSGSIPQELVNLSNLKKLWLDNNRLSGDIPPGLGKLVNMKDISLSNNQLNGSIPPELGNLGNLGVLSLGNNQLSGSIPPELGNLSNLWAFSLYSNQLTGNIPSSLINLDRLNSANIDYNGLYTDNATLRAFLDSKSPGWENTQTIAPSNVSAAAISDTSILVSWTPIAYTGDSGGYNVFYSTTAAGPWTYAGRTTDKSASTYKITGLNAGTKYYIVINTQTNPHRANNNWVVSNYSEEVSATPDFQVDKEPPFGSFDTPLDGSTARGSIPVCGWALDNFGIDGVKIYREPSADAGEEPGGGLVLIGDAVFVEGARPDVQQTYPTYPDNHKAGWGYMMLTNFLPNGGNGTFILHAIAADVEGNQTTLGIKTVICDNANAVEPFGAIDTPGQGGTASGKKFVNFGWVLTPLPNTIPTNGSTITVWVNGVPLGHPVYNQYRADIAALFPGYNNSNGAIGYFYLDTTAYENGVHTIQWTAMDDAWNADGIGSRYFMIQNSSEATTSTARNEGMRRPPITDKTIPIDYSMPVRIKKGYNENIEPQIVYPDENGTIHVEIEELERLEIHLNEGTEVDKGEYKILTEPYKRFRGACRGSAGFRVHPAFSGSLIENTPNSRYMGYLLSGKLLKSLPIGSTFDSASGVFCWNPGPGFIGQYRFVFVEKGPGGQLIKKNINIKIIPKFRE
ncbi:MAG: hypothetical protein GTO45_33665 [Candidatus Aminicenantes bacterium]|nr:hypothetical protein [Candidatus Aminicenantes bacterium]NIM83658.1 hypothetical protein [Candidatus Aminicenantes bacterium]NIN23082.1 hypothetical protein [Candidatus Aminicenantes bacterium]NIN46809.1 hypothetical protein [Candidatus Aminicenantes bacterium]NIN89731.1 hypothetical protein [Candidatus Aminicenantes bacterium]